MICAAFVLYQVCLIESLGDKASYAPCLILPITYTFFSGNKVFKGRLKPRKGYQQGVTWHNITEENRFSGIYAIVCNLR